MTDFPDSGQFDLFEHSRAVALANDVIDALLARDAALSTERFNDLCIEEPGHRACEALQTLCRALGEWPRPSANPAEVAEAVRWLDGTVHLCICAVTMPWQQQGPRTPFRIATAMSTRCIGLRLPAIRPKGLFHPGAACAN